MSAIILDHDNGVVHPVRDGFTMGLIARQDAIIELAKQVRQRELDLLSTQDRWTGMPCPYPFVYGAFGWFATSLTSYLQLVPVADKLRAEPALLHALTRDRAAVKALGQSLVKSVCPEIQQWRNQVGAHAALSDPRLDDNLALLLASVSYSVSASNRRFFVGMTGHAIISASSRTPLASHEWKPWSITETFDRLAPRFWPEYHLDDLVSPSTSAD